MLNYIFRKTKQYLTCVNLLIVMSIFGVVGLSTLAPLPIAYAQVAWDGSRLEFMSCEFNPNLCGEIRTGICNRGSAPMAGFSTWQVFYSPTGNPLTEGTMVGSGQIVPLINGGPDDFVNCQLIQFNAWYAGNYQFIAFQRPGSPDPTAQSTIVTINQGAENCLALPSPEPSPSPSASPSSSPASSSAPASSPGVGGSSQSGRRTSLANDNLQCPTKTFEAVFDVKDNGNGIKDVLVKFSYNGVNKEARTNENGRAKVTFDQNGNGILTASADGWDSQSMSLTMPVCETVAVQPSPKPKAAQILGASTLANTSGY